MLYALSAERVKLFSTRGWLIGLLSFMALALLLPLGNSLTGKEPVGPNQPFSGILGFAMLAAMVVAATSVTQEYRYKTILVTHQAEPARWRPLVAKAILSAAFAFVLSAAMAMVTLTLISTLVPHQRRATWTLSGSLDNVATSSLTVAILAVLAVGVGAIIRSTPAAVALIVLWQTPIELIISKVPKIGEILQPYLVFNNVLMAGTGDSAGIELHWGQAGAIGYLAAAAIVGLLVGLAITQRRVTE